MKKSYLLTAATCIIAVLMIGIFKWATTSGISSENTVKVGFIYDSDDSTPYTYNFILAQHEAEAKFSDKIQTVVKSNTPSSQAGKALQELISDGCNIIFSTSEEYGKETKKMAKAFPDIQFCQVGCSDSDDEPVLKNYHTFMGEIYQGRYICGIVAGLKLLELKEKNTLNQKEAMIGYVAAFPYAEIISGYTAFILGVRSVYPNAKLYVRYTNTWSDNDIEKECAKKLIDEGCIIIAQHSDTTGPAIACEDASSRRNVFHIGYNQSMMHIAPTSSLISTRINWAPYFLGAISAVMNDKKIESEVNGRSFGNDMCGGIKDGWVEMVDLNSLIAAKGSQEVIEDAIKKIEKNKIRIFSGDYIGIDPNDPKNTYDLNNGYEENKTSSAPSFSYILKDVVITEN